MANAYIGPEGLSDEEKNPAESLDYNETTGQYEVRNYTEVSGEAPEEASAEARAEAVELNDSDRDALAEAFSADRNSSLETFRDLAEQFPDNTQNLSPDLAKKLLK
jgi:hypothetical protein